MAERRARLGKRVIDSIEPGDGEIRVWDTDLAGFHVRIRKGGRKTFAVRYRLGAGSQKTLTLGPMSEAFTPDKAREAAKDALEAVRRGDDPMTAKRATREALTVDGLIDAYLADGPKTKLSKRASTWAIDASNLRRHVSPLLGRKLADRISQADAARAVRDIADRKTAGEVKTEKARARIIVKGGEGTARRTRITTAAMYAWGIEQGHVKTNPFAGVKLTAAPKRERFLTRAEATHLIATIDLMASENAINSKKGVNPAFGDALKLLLLTGARKTEILGLRAGEVDLGRRQLVLPPERTKAGGSTGTRRIVLSAEAAAILAKRIADKAPADAFVFAAARGDGHAVGLRKAFSTVVKRAKLGELRVHDLRHTAASLAIADGASLFLVSKILGHASARTSERYAHLSADPLTEAVDRIGKSLVRSEPEAPNEPANDAAVA